MKNSLRNESFQLESSHKDLQEGRILKARVSLLDNGYLLWQLVIIVFVFITWLLIRIYNSPEGSFSIIFSGLIWFLISLIFLLNRPSTVSVISEKLIIKRLMRKPVIIEKEDVTQILIKKNIDHSLRWGFRLFYIIMPLFFVATILNDLKLLGSSASEYPEFSTYLMQIAQVILFLVLIYNGELIMPYQQEISINTRSNLNVKLYINDPEEIMGILKKENE